MINLLKYLAILVLGSVLGIAGYGLLNNSWHGQMPDAGSESREPLYWVAPMDPSYRSNKPGKSRMGMDLIPVYEEDAEAVQTSPGTVRISPDVVNNLGVRTAKVQHGYLDMEIETVGYVQYDEDRLVHMHSRVEGWIEKLYVNSVGDPVKKGMPIYRIYSPTLVNAQEELILALKRNSRSLIQAAEKRLESLQLPANAIERIKKTGEIQQTVTVHAPQSGVIKKLNIRDGFYVSPQMTMISIGVLDEVWVVGEVFERQVAMVNTGDKVRMTLDYLPGRQWVGEIDYIYPTLNPETRTAQVRIRFDNPEHLLKPGMFARLEIIPGESGEKTLLIPREALIRTGDQNRVVLAMGEGRFKSIEVKVGRISEREVEILEGLSDGDRIVTSAQFLIDSESSKTSDFRRMNHDGHAADSDGH